MSNIIVAIHIILLICHYFKYFTQVKILWDVQVDIFIKCIVFISHNEIMQWYCIENSIASSIFIIKIEISFYWWKLKALPLHCEHVCISFHGKEVYNSLVNFFLSSCLTYLDSLALLKSYWWALNAQHYVACIPFKHEVNTSEFLSSI